MTDETDDRLGTNSAFTLSKHVRDLADGSTLICIGLEIVVWQVKDFIGNAVAFSLVGFFLGPMYPIV